MSDVFVRRERCREFLTESILFHVCFPDRKKGAFIGISTSRGISFSHVACRLTPLDDLEYTTTTCFMSALPPLEYTTTAAFMIYLLANSSCLARDRTALPSSTPSDIVKKPENSNPTSESKSKSKYKPNHKNLIVSPTDYLTVH